jgi:hypothetical protein
MTIAPFTLEQTVDFDPLLFVLDATRDPAAQEIVRRGHADGTLQVFLQPVLRRRRGHGSHGRRFDIDR